MSYQRKMIMTTKPARGGRRQVVYQPMMGVGDDVESTGFRGRGHVPRHHTIVWQPMGDDVEATGFTGRGHIPRRHPVLMQAMGDDPDCNSVVGSMTNGQSCTLPDGSNIAIWNGSKLSNPAGGAIDSANANALVAGGWSPSQVNSASAITTTSGSSSSNSSGSGWGQVGNAAGSIISSLFGPKPATGTVIVPQQGMSDTTKLLLAGAAVVGVAILLKNRG